MKKPFIISWFDKNTIRHLRFPFSFFLMPVFLFALSQAETINWTNALITFVILHLLIFPASNGYNSFQDKDETSIGGLRNPPKVTKNLFYATLFFDLLAVITAYLITPYLSFFILVFITMSRLYSYRKIRLKKYPITAFAIVAVFQGAFVYLMALTSFEPFSILNVFSSGNLICMAISSLFIGSMYPLTQIYQHEADKKDGVITISYKLGYMGTFIFSAILFTIAVILLFYYFNINQKNLALVLFFVLMLPVIIRLMKWTNEVSKNTSKANFENTMKMNVLTSTFMNLYFILLVFNSFYNWF